MISPRNFRRLPGPLHRRWSTQYEPIRRDDAELGPSDSGIELPGSHADLELELADSFETEEPAYAAVVVPLDGSEASERALPVAASIASRMHVPLRLVHVSRPRPFWDRGGFALLDDRAQLRFCTHTEEYLQSVAERLFDVAGLDVTTKILQGDDVAATLDQFCGSGRTLVVTMRSRRGALCRLWKGCITDDLARRLRVPMLVLPPEEQPVRLGKRRILIPVGKHGPASGFAEQLLPLGSLWDSEYWLVHAMPYRGFFKRGRGIGTGRTASAGPVHPDRDRAWAAIDETSASLQLEPSRIEARVVVDTCGPAQSILRHASLYRAQMIVVPPSPPKSRWLAQGWHAVASQILWQSQVPVLLCKASDSPG